MWAHRGDLVGRVERDLVGLGSEEVVDAVSQFGRETQDQITVLRNDPRRLLLSSASPNFLQRPGGSGSCRMSLVSSSSVGIWVCSVS